MVVSDNGKDVLRKIQPFQRLRTSKETEMNDMTGENKSQTG